MERGGRARTIALGGGDGLDLTLVVGGAVDLVGRGSAGQAFPYGGAKAALNVLANVVHQELANDGIRTVAIAPGLTDTPGMRAIVGEDYIARVADQYPTSTRAASTGRPRSTRSSARRCIPIRTICISSPRSAPGAVPMARGTRPWRRTS